MCFSNLGPKIDRNSCRELNLEVLSGRIELSGSSERAAPINNDNRSGFKPRDRGYDHIVKPTTDHSNEALRRTGLTQPLLVLVAVRLVDCDPPPSSGLRRGENK